jgi:hypothetical protein
MAKRKRVPAHKRSKDKRSKDKRSKDEIVAEIMKILEAPLVEKYVSKLIDDLCKNPQPFTGNRRNNIDYLNDLRNGIKRFKRLLRKAPAPLRTVLFSPEFARGLLATQGTTGDFNPNLRNYLSQREPARLTQLVGVLDGLDARCEETARLALGTHAGANQLKRDAATASRDVIDSSITFYPEKKLSFSCSKTSEYCRIASLFFEAVTGEDESDLRRQCKAVAPPSLRTKQ